MFELTSVARFNCITFNIIDDNFTEGTENFTIALVQGRMDVEFVNVTATIVVIDNDGKNIPLISLFVIWFLVKLVRAVVFMG